jgi:hypothetical protein
MLKYILLRDQNWVQEPFIKEEIYSLPLRNPIFREVLLVIPDFLICHTGFLLN